MMEKQELTYWVTLAHMQGITTRRKNELYVNCYRHEPRLTITQLFEQQPLWDELGLTIAERQLFTAAHEQLANNSFLVEDLLNQGYDILPIDSPDYPQTLKENLKITAPTVLYVKGNKALLNSNAVAIVGSRNADDVSLLFTGNVARQACQQGKTVVSGFAKGVDRKALDAAVACSGSSIIVLPQGIATFASGFKEYYKPLAQGKLLVMSLFHPKAPWSVEFAMARNPIIYAMANEIFVARSDDKGGTWAGVMDGMKRGRQISVRKAEANEKCANNLLISKGAIAVDINGNVIPPEQLNIYIEPTNEERLEQIRQLLTGGTKLTVTEIISRLKVEWTETRMRKLLRSCGDIEEVKISRKLHYCLKGQLEPSLFS